MLGLVNVEPFIGSFLKARPSRTWNEVIISDLKENKVNKDLTKDKCMDVFHKKASNLSKHRKQTLKYDNDVDFSRQITDLDICFFNLELLH